MPDLSYRRIVGFACNQGFAFFLLYMGGNVALGEFERADAAFMLAFMVVGFALLWRLSPARRESLLARPLLFVYAAIMAVAGLFGWLADPHAAQHALAPQALSLPAWTLARGALLGVPNAFLLTAWGRSFGQAGTGASVPEVMAGSLVGALIALAFSLVEASAALFAVFVLPIISAAYISATSEPGTQPAPAQPDAAEALSAKVLTGTLCFGAAAGLMDTFNTAPGGAAQPSYVLSMLLFAAFLVGSLSLLLTEGFGRGAALNKSYRLAVFLMGVGFLVVPLDLLFPGDAVVLAGYLGLEAVLIALFLVVASIAGIDAAEGFSRGFVALFAGELAGLVCANAMSAVGAPVYGAVALAGALALLAYIFLFTERDFSALSEIADTEDAFQALCARIAADYALSRREAEVLPLALRGRTAERIAAEFTVSKSTIDTHLRRIYAKCGVHSRQELLDLAEQLGEQR